MEENETPRMVDRPRNVLIRAREAGHVLGRSLRSVHRLIAAGKLKGRRDGCITYVETDSLNDYFDNLPECRKKPQEGKEAQ